MNEIYKVNSIQKIKKNTCKSVLALCAAFAMGTPCSKAQSFYLTSPDGKTTVTIDTGDTLSFGISRNGRSLLDNSSVCLIMDGGRTMGKGMQALATKETRGTSKVSNAPFYRQNSFEMSYVELNMPLNEGGIIFRAYNEGVAYRFYTSRGSGMVMDEIAHYRFPRDFNAHIAYSTNPKDPFSMSFQNTYDATFLSNARPVPAFLPVCLDAGGGLKMTILESDVENYPGMFLKSDTLQRNLRGVFARYPSTMGTYDGRKQRYVVNRENYIARITKNNFPWRIFAITEKDADMPTNNLVYALASPNRIGDTKWIKDGKVAWDWWNDWGLSGVPFKAGINTDTYRYFIDFAAANKLEYILLDEGWYNPQTGNMLNAIKDVDLPALVRYGNEKGVGIVLWTVFNVLDSQLEAACTKYSKMGIKGFKVDFLDRNDQTAVEMAYRIASACARHHLILDYHGIYEPTGLNRTYPNVLNFESVFGMEEAKWARPDTDMPTYDVTFPFIRGMAGPVDFTPGAMLNATKRDFRAIYNHPMSMGTRCHQAAMYVVYDSPFTMLADAPTMYEKEPAYTQFIAQLPTHVDETRVLDGEMGKFIVTARRQGTSWYVGGLANGEARDINLSFDFLDKSLTYDAVLCHDGPNADRTATDYRIEAMPAVNLSQPMNIHIAPAGGFVLRLNAR